MMNYFIDPLTKYATFSGTSTRKEYWLFLLISCFINIALMVADRILGTVVVVPNYQSPLGYDIYHIFSILFSLVVLIPNIAIAVRRIRDAGKNPHIAWLFLIPLINLYPLIVLFFPSKTEVNLNK